MRILIPAVWGGAVLTAALRFVHMLQLNAYQTPGYLRWLSRRSGASLLRLIWASPTLLLFLWPDDRAWWILIFFYALSAFFARPPKKAKKPLKYTSRVIRLLATLALMLAVAGFCFWRFWPAEGGFIALPVFFFAGYFLTPIWVFLCNILNLPIQKGVEAHYISDARRRLDAHPGLIVLGLTGSYGKTSTKHFLERLLSEKYSTLITPGSYNTPMGVVRTVRERLLPTHEFFVCEMGARHVGDIKELCHIVHPQHGLITSVGEQHLETFGTLENVASTKFELIDALPPDGMAFLNMSSAAVKNRPVSRSALRYGISEQADGTLDYRAFDIQAEPDGLRFTVEAPGGESLRFSTSLIGRHNVENLTAAIAVAHTFGIPLSRLSAAVKTLDPTPHRLHLLKPAQGLAIIDDAFNANPEGAHAALEALSLFDGCKILVTPGFVELGERQDICHEALGRQAAGLCDYVALVGKKQTASIARGLKAGGFPEKNLFVGDTLQEAMSFVREIPSDGQTKYVLLENDLPDNYN